MKIFSYSPRSAMPLALMLSGWRHDEERLVRPPPIEQARGMRVPCVARDPSCCGDPMEQFEAAFLPNRPEQLFLRFEVMLDRGALHVGRRRDLQPLGRP